jgi:Protein of unknown function (DUF2996)
MTDEKTPAAKPPMPEATPVAKKEKPPAIEAKPFAEFIQTYYLPSLKDGLVKANINADLKFLKQNLPVVGYANAPECWQIEAKWTVPGQTRQFNLYFYEENIQASRGFSITDSGRTASTLESFRIDERKVTLDLLVSGTLQRLNSQKWLTRN